MGSPSIGATTGSGEPSVRDPGEAVRSILIEQVQTFVTCPLHFALRYVYRAPAKPKTYPTVLGEDLGAMFVWIHAKLMENRELSWSKILVEWERRWGTRKFRMDEMLAGREFGYRTLLDVWNAIRPELEVLAYKYPLRRVIGDWEIHGSIDVVRAYETKGKGYSGREVQLITVDPYSTKMPVPHESGRRIDYLLAKYGLELDVRSSFGKIAKKVTTWVYLPQLGKMAELDVDESSWRSAMNWVTWVLEEIDAGHFYPRTGSQCNACPYIRICDVKYFTRESLEDKQAFKEVHEACRNRCSSTSTQPS